MQKVVGLSLVSLGLIVGGCRSNVSPDTYSVGSVGYASRTIRGTIINARPVSIGGTNSGLGAAMGAAGGGLVGSRFGGTAGTAAAGAVIGVIAGAVAGSEVEEAATRQNGQEYVVQGENGALLTIVQGGVSPLATGQRVLVIYGNPTRVIPDTSQPVS
jgi:outer membrane lipoprotein SlyB